MFKLSLFLSLLLPATHALANSPEAAPPPLEFGIDRPGMDYRSFNIAANPRLCQQACNTDHRCRAYTYVRPGVQGFSARCWLKHGVPAPVRNMNCSSGRAPRIEVGVDRPGMDFANFNLAVADPNLCRAACYRDVRCRAWTYVRPGVQGPTARCWLKHGIPFAGRSACCSSGIR